MSAEQDVEKLREANIRLESAQEQALLFIEESRLAPPSTAARA